MLPPVLKTKLYIPSLRPGLVRRPHLVELLEAGIHRRLTLVSAPAGFGKTTLISEWVNRSEHPAAWLSLEDSDNDPVRFLSYFIAALQTIKPRLAEGLLANFQPLKPAAVESVLTGLLNEITEIDRPFVLVLDDYHLIQDNSIHGYVSFLLEHLPAQLHLVLSTRADPPFSLTLLRARGQMMELRSSDLRFTAEETAEFLNKLMGLNLSVEDITALAARTEGWIAGLQMAAVSIRGREDIPEFIRALTSSNRYILDYLLEEVLQHQPESVQTFLLKTSILERLSGPLCEVLSGQKDGQEILQQLERDNLFIFSIDTEHRWYRYHRLFADLLRRRLKQQDADRVAELHRRAGEWYEQNDMVTDAIEQTLAGQDFERAIELIEEHAESSLMRSEFATFLKWIEALPESLVCKRSLLCVYYALSLLMAGAPMNDIQARIDAALQGESPEQVSGQLAAFRAFLAAIQGDIEESRIQSKRALKLLPEKDHFFRSTVNRVLVNVTYANSGNIPESIPMFEDSIRVSRQAGNITVAGALLSELGELFVIQGQLHQAQATYERALELSTDSAGAPLPVAGLAKIGLGNLLRQWNDLESAESMLRDGIDLVKRLGVIGTLDGHNALARVKQSQGHLVEAEQILDAIQKIAIRFDASELDDLQVELQRARLWIAQGKIEAAARWHSEWTDRRAQTNKQMPYVLGELEQILRARILLAQGKSGDCLSTAGRLQKSAEKLGRDGVVIETLVLKCLAYRHQNNDEEALKALDQALALAEPEGYMRIFLDEGSPMAQLLYEAANRGIRKEYTGRILSNFPLHRELRKAGSPTDDLIEPLSRREIEVLQLLAEGASNKEAARRLFISLPTVKWHTSNIYGKLGVQNRTEAVTKARALGLISGP